MNPAVEWWSGPMSGLIFGLVGSFIGLIGAGVGVVVGIGAPRGKWRGVATALHAIGGVIGLAMVSLGVAALIAGQPFHVWFFAMQCGVIGSVLFIGLYFMVTRRVYLMHEQRRMDARLMQG